MTELAKIHFQIVAFVFWLKMLECVHLTESNRVHFLVADIIFSDNINCAWWRCKPSNDIVTRTVHDNFALIKRSWASETEYEFGLSTACGRFIGKTVTCEKRGNRYTCNADIPYCEAFLIYAGSVVNYLGVGYEINNITQPSTVEPVRRTFQVPVRGRYWTRPLSISIRCPGGPCFQDQLKLLILHYNCTSALCRSG